MSIFRPITLGCPTCGTAVAFEAVHSVNVDSRPDLRQQIVDETFQEEVCSQCGEAFRLDPAFNLVDTKRRQWIAAAPLANLAQWKAMEEQAEALFERAYGDDAAEIAQEIGKELKPRITFGWPALREKLVAHNYELDDVTLELCKALVMRTTDSPVTAQTELRLVEASPSELTFCWIRTAQGVRGPTVRVSRSVYYEIAADVEGAWGELRAELTVGIFVDLNRLLFADGDVAPEPRVDAEEVSGTS